MGVCLKHSICIYSVTGPCSYNSGRFVGTEDSLLFKELNAGLHLLLLYAFINIACSYLKSFLFFC